MNISLHISFYFYHGKINREYPNSTVLCPRCEHNGGSLCNCHQRVIVRAKNIPTVTTTEMNHYFLENPRLVFNATCQLWYELINYTRLQLKCPGYGCLADNYTHVKTDSFHVTDVWSVDHTAATQELASKWGGIYLVWLLSYEPVKNSIIFVLFGFSVL